MADSKVKKPSLTQRRKISGSSDLSKTSSKSDSSKSKISKPKTTKVVEESDDISVVKVVLVVVAVILVAVVAAFIIQATQGGDNDENIAEEPAPTEVVVEEPEPTEDQEVEPTEVVEDTPEPTAEPTEEPEAPENEVLTNEEFSTETQFLNTSNTGTTIRTYRYLNTAQYYQFSLPMQNDAIPSASAYYDNDNLILEVEDVSSFVSCGYLNDNSTALAYGNVESATCSKSGSTVTFSFIVTNQPEFRLTTGSVEIDGESVESILLQIK